jgi:hypothetical protein
MNEIVLENEDRSIRGSQHGEDGITLAIFKAIGCINKYYVEFGASNGEQCNTRVLRETEGWTGLLMDQKYPDNTDINLKKEFVTKDNINDLFKKYEVPCSFDLLSIDIDYNDWYMWYYLDNKYKPRVVISEINSTHPPGEDKVVIYNELGWDYSNYFGGSLTAFYNLAQFKGYSLVYLEKSGVDAFFILNEALQNINFKNINNVDLLYKPPRYGNSGFGHGSDQLNRTYLKSTDILNSITT